MTIGCEPCGDRHLVTPTCCPLSFWVGCWSSQCGAYAPIHLPGGWGRTGCGRGNNSVVANRIANSNLARCCDGGQVYTLGPQPNSRIERNHLMNYHGGTRTDNKGHRQDPNAIYHDNGSGGWTDSQNVIEGNYQHYCGVFVLFAQSPPAFWPCHDEIRMSCTFAV